MIFEVCYWNFIIQLNLKTCHKVIQFKILSFWGATSSQISGSVPNQDSILVSAQLPQLDKKNTFLFSCSSKSWGNFSLCFSGISLWEFVLSVLSPTILFLD